MCKCINKKGVCYGKQIKICDGKINFRCKSDLCQHTCCGPFAGISSELANVDNWIEIAERMITHENCIGTIFFNSLNSYISNPVARGSKHKHNIRYLEKYNSNLETQKLWKQNI